MRRATVPIVSLLAVLAVAGCGKDTSPATKTTAAKAPVATATTPAIPPRSAHDGCKAVAPAQPLADPDRRLSRKKLDPKRTYVAVLNTNCGVIRIQLAVMRAPKTTASFAGLVRNHFYDGLSFHRIANPGGNPFVIQGGDPLGTGNGGPGYTVVEKPSKKTRYVRGVVAMAKTGTDPAGASGSQFFIVTAADAGLPPEYAVLGRVVGGTKTVDRIAALATDADEQPIDPVVMKTVRIVTR